MIRGVQGTRVFASGQWIQSPTFIEWVNATRQISLLTGGLPFHRRSSAKTLDTILIPAGETARSFRFGLGVNLPYGELAAHEFQTRPLVRRVSRRTDVTGGDCPLGDLALIKFSRLNVQAVWWAPMLDHEGKVIGMQFRLREIQGRSGKLLIHSRLALSSACRTNFRSEFLHDLETDEHQVVLNFQSFDYAQIQLNWKQ
jgi:alpha-mannosidase